MQGERVDAGDVGDGTQYIPDSVSNADTTGFMRVSGNGYMYNFATKSLQTNMPYTIVVKDGNDVVATAVIVPKK